MDDALMERLHIVLDLSFASLRPKPEDMFFNVFSESFDPRIKEPEKKDLYPKVVSLHNDFKNAEFDIAYAMINTYLVYGLDYCSLGKADYSKANLGSRIESILTNEGRNHELATITGSCKGMSPRQGLSISAFTRALETVAKAKILENSINEPKEIDDSQILLDSVITAIKIISPYSGIFSQHKVNEIYYGNPVLAADEFAKETAKEISDKQEPARVAFKHAVDGKLSEDDLSEFKDKWGFMEKILTKIQNQTIQREQNTPSKQKI
jgi:hypothetical protein